MDAAAEDFWQLALHALSRAPLGPGELASSCFRIREPASDLAALARRRGRRQALPRTGRRTALPGADRRSGVRLRTGRGPSSSPVLPRHRWANQADAAFALIEKALPPGAGISEITLSDDQIELRIESPTPAFDGKPPAPYGDQEFDEYGVADRDWWYPRTDPSFGCEKGLPLAEVRAEYAAARARLGTSSLSQAWYSCSPAYSDGHHGAWHLFPR